MSSILRDVSIYDSYYLILSMLIEPDTYGIIKYYVPGIYPISNRTGHKIIPVPSPANIYLYPGQCDVEYLFISVLLNFFSTAVVLIPTDSAIECMVTNLSTKIM